LEEMIEHFSLDAISKSASAFNTEKLNWLNEHYIKTLPAEEVAPFAKWHFDQQGIDCSNGPSLESVIAVQADRVTTLKELAEISQYFYSDFEEFDEKAAKKHLRVVAKEPLQAVKEALLAVDEWSPENIQAAINSTAEKLEVGMGKIGMPLRVAATGSGNSPSLDVTLKLMNKDKIAQRIDKALIYIANRENS
jgi:glutamyl-tRNA synthetase